MNTGPSAVGQWCTSDHLISGLPWTSVDLHGLGCEVVETATAPPRSGSEGRAAWLSGGGGIRTLGPPKTDNGFRDRDEHGSSQGFCFSCASLFASQRHASRVAFSVLTKSCLSEAVSSSTPLVASISAY